MLNVINKFGDYKNVFRKKHANRLVFKKGKVIKVTAFKVDGKTVKLVKIKGGKK